MSRRLPIVPTLVVALAVAAMIALGVWQLRRAEWKADLLARYEQAQAMSSNVPWPRSEEELEHSLFRWSQFECQRVLGMRVTAATSAEGEKGVAQIARCAIDDLLVGQGHCVLPLENGIDWFQWLVRPSRARARPRQARHRRPAGRPRP